MIAETVIKKETVCDDLADAIAYESRCLSDRGYDTDSSALPDSVKMGLFDLLQVGVKSAETASDNDETLIEMTAEAIDTLKGSQAKEEATNANGATSTQAVSSTQQQAVVRRVFNRRMIPFVCTYCLVFAAVIALILGAVPGSAWEGTATLYNIPDNFSFESFKAAPIVAGNEIGATAEKDVIVESTAAESRKAYTGNINKIMTDEGVVAIDNTAVTTGTEETTNWFDKFCDFLSNAFGG